MGAGSGGRGCGKRGKTRPFLAKNVFLSDHFFGPIIFFLFFLPLP